MLNGILFAVLTGFIWTAAGIVISRCAKGDFDLCAYSLLHTLISGLLALAVYTDFYAFQWTRGKCTLYGMILAAGIANAFAQYFVRRAMCRGNHASIWAMMQTCMLFPFFFGLLVFGEKANLSRFAGIFLLIAGVLLPCLKGFLTIRNWFLPSVAGLFLYGTAQILYLIPSHCKKLSDPVLLRPALVCFGGTSSRAWSIKYRNSPENFFSDDWHVRAARDRTGTFFRSLDILSVCGNGSITIPLTVGTNIAGFGFYSLVFLREKKHPPRLCVHLDHSCGPCICRIG